MTNPRPTNLAESIHQRLLNKAKITARPFSDLLQYFAMERFLYRLSCSEHVGNFVLKGALMFTAWKAPLSRSTMDIDLLAFADNQLITIEKIVHELCQQDVEPDGLYFDAKTVVAKRIKEGADYEGVRIRFTGFFGNCTYSYAVGYRVWRCGVARIDPRQVSDYS